MRNGFTLVELSIVLLIIGLLIGGILTGKSLITAAENQAIISDFEKYQLAANNYNKKYRAWPGDDDLALYDIVTSDNGRWNDVAVVNGNGNGLLGDTVSEFYQFWLHLSKAELITGTFTGVDGSVPVAAIEDFYITHYYDTVLINSGGQGFMLSLSPIIDGIDEIYSLKYNSLLAIDKKIDNGLLDSGNFMSYDCAGSGSPVEGYCRGAIYIYKR